MSYPTIRIGDTTTFPEISAVHDMGSSIEITSLDDIDLGLLANQKKLISSTPPRPQSPGAPTMSLRPSDGDGIEFINLEDTNVTFDVKPSVGASDTIRILRDSGPSAASMQRSDPTMMLNSGPQVSAPTVAPPPAPATKSWFSGFGGTAAGANGSGNGTGNTSSGGIGSWFGGGSNNNTGDSNIGGEYVSAYLTPEQESAQKSQGLTLLERMDRAGVGGTKMTMANTLDEVNAEVARRKDSKGLEASMRFQRSMMRTVTSGLEFLNSRYDPLGLSLDGWSEQVEENIEDYDEMFEELYDKYKDKSKVAPEVRLVMSLGLSAATCHITNTMFKSKMPGAEEILRNNPGLAQQMAQAAAAHAVGPGFAKFVSLGGSGRNGTGPNSAAAMAMNSSTPPNEMRGGGGPMAFSAPMGSGIGGAIPSLDPRGMPNMGEGPRTARREMRGPNGVEDILRTLDAAGEMPQRMVPPPAMDAEEVASIGSGMTTETMRRNGLNRRRKATTVQPTGATLTLNV